MSSQILTMRSWVLIMNSWVLIMNFWGRSGRRRLSRSSAETKAGMASGAFPLLSDLSKKAFEFFPIQAHRAHVRANDVLAKFRVHLDHNRPRHASPSHDQMIAFDMILHAAN